MSDIHCNTPRGQYWEDTVQEYWCIIVIFHFTSPVFFVVVVAYIYEKLQWKRRRKRRSARTRIRQSIKATQKQGGLYKHTSLHFSLSLLWHPLRQPRYSSPCAHWHGKLQHIWGMHVMDGAVFVQSIYMGMGFKRIHIHLHTGAAGSKSTVSTGRTKAVL